MALFQAVQKIYKTMAIHPSSSQPYQFCSLNVKLQIFLIIITQTLIASTAFFLFKANTIQSLSDSFYVSLTHVFCLIYIAIKIWKVTDILQLINQYETFIQLRSMDSSSNATMYAELNRKIELMTELMYFAVVKLTSVGVMVPALIITIVNYYVYELGNESFFLPLLVMLPYNWKTPIMYVFTLLFEYADAYFLTISIVPVLCFFIGSCFLLITFVEDITKDLSHLDFVKNEATSSDNEKKINAKIVTENVCTIIERLSDMKQFVSEFNGIYEFIVTDFFLWTLFTVCSAFLALQSEISENELNAFDLCRTLFLTFWSIFFIFFLCECGERVTNQFEMFNHGLDQCNWYLYPIGMQRTFSVVMVNAQQSMYIRGYGNLTCERDAFKRTVKTGFSYFMTLRQFEG